MGLLKLIFIKKRLTFLNVTIINNGLTLLAQFYGATNYRKYLKKKSQGVYLTLLIMEVCQDLCSAMPGAELQYSCQTLVTTSSIYVRCFCLIVHNLLCVPWR